MEISTLASDLIALKGDKKLEISFDGELLVNPYLMMVELHNLGNIDIENIEVFIKKIRMLPMSYLVLFMISQMAMKIIGS